MKKLSIVKPKNGTPRKERGPQQPSASRSMASPAKSVNLTPSEFANILKVAEDNGKSVPRGYYQQAINKDFFGFTPEEIRAVATYLNPVHAQNAMDAAPLPDSDSGRVYLFKDTWTTTLTAAGPTIILTTMPFFERPFAYSLAGTTASLRAVQPPGALWGTSVNAASFMSDIHAYKYRCVGKGFTVVDSTPVISRAGAATLFRKTSDVDCSSYSFAIGTVTSQYNQRILQRFPASSTAASNTGTAQTWEMGKGAYCVSHHEDHGWVVRTDPTTKCYPHTVLNNTDANCALYVTDSVTGTATSMTDVDASSFAAVGPQDHTDVVGVIFEGCTSATTKVTVKFSVVYEIVLKLSSPLLKTAVIRPRFNPRLMDLLHAYECQLDRGGLFSADANFWNELWSGFKRFWKGGGGALTSAAVNAAAPGAGTAAGAIGDVLTGMF